MTRHKYTEKCRDMKIEKELLSCPFCGTTDVQMKTSKVVFWVQCNNTECFCSMGGERTEENAIKAWNRRQSNRRSGGDED